MDKKKIYRKYIKNKVIIKKLILPSYIEIEKLTKKLKIKKEIINNILKSMKLKKKNIIKSEIINIILECINIISFEKKSNYNLNFKKNSQIKRNLIVTFMGHVDSGKTTIIKNILKKNIKEDKGITQNIKFYKYNKFYLIDTPGHEDFNIFRKNSIKMTDIVILVITLEEKLNNNIKNIIKYINNFKVPLIIILNKTDIKNYKFINILKNLIKCNLIFKKNINNILFIKNKKNCKKNIKNIIQNLLLFYIIINAKKIKKFFFKAIIIENKNYKKLGVLTTLFIKSGYIKSSDILIFKNSFYKIKFILNEKNQIIKNSKNESLVKLTGISNLTKSGDHINKLNNLKLIKKLIITRKKKNLIINQSKNYKLKNILNFKDKTKNIINLILIVENENIIYSIKKNLNKINDKYIKIKIIDYNIVGLNLNLIKKAKNLKCYIINFNIKIKNNILKNLKEMKVIFKNFKSIYQINKYIKLIKEKIIFKKKLLGKLLVNQIFKLKNKTIAGCEVLKGMININSKIKIIRDEKIIYIGKIESLNYIKKPVITVKKGFSCGLSLKDFEDIKKNDILQIYNE